jgi:hypothetical protein
VHKAFILLEGKIKGGEKLYPITIEEITIDDDNRIHPHIPSLRDFRRKPDFGMLIAKHEKELALLPEWATVLECVSRDEIIKEHVGQMKSPFGGIVIDEATLLDRILLMSIDEEKPLHFDTDLFNSAYATIEDYFYSKTLTRKSTCLLLGFDSETEEMDLEDGLKVRKVAKGEIVELWRSSEWFRALVEFSVEFRYTPLKYVAELSIQAPKLTDNEKYQAIDADTKLEKLVCALRLFKKGWIDYPFIKEIVTPNISHEVSYSMKHSKMNIISPPSGITYRLTTDEAREFKALYDRIEKKIDSSEVYLKRFSDTYRRLSVEDKLIDYMIAFESLYLAGEAPLEMPYKLAHRVALLLCKDEVERKQTFLEMKKAYSLRSDIVHGERKTRSPTEPIKIGNREYSLSDFIQRIEEHLRRSIRLFLEKPKQSWTDLMFKNYS